MMLEALGENMLDIEMSLNIMEIFNFGNDKKIITQEILSNISPINKSLVVASAVLIDDNVNFGADGSLVSVDS